jgi:hypothetical protein
MALDLLEKVALLLRMGMSTTLRKQLKKIIQSPPFMRASIAFTKQTLPIMQTFRSILRPQEQRWQHFVLNWQLHNNRWLI